MNSRTARIVAEGFHAEAAACDTGSQRFFNLLDQSRAWDHIATRLEQEEARPGPFAPFKAWVVVDKDGKRVPSETHSEEDDAKNAMIAFNDVCPSGRPHRVIPVRVTPERGAE